MYMLNLCLPWTFRACSVQCQRTGCVGARCFSCCDSGSPLDGSWYNIQYLYFWWNQWDCQSNCRYHCMLYREKERAELGLKHENGLLNVNTDSRLAALRVERTKYILSSIVLLTRCLHIRDKMTCIYTGTGCCSIFSSKPCDALSWLAFFFQSPLL